MIIKNLYMKMFDYESLLTNKSDIIKLENMDYDTSVFKVPKIYLESINQQFNHNAISYSDFGGSHNLLSLIKRYNNIETKTYFDYDVFVSSGTGILLHTAIELIGKKLKKEKREEVILFAPDYSLFYSLVANKSLKTNIIHGERKNNFLISIKQIEEAINSKTGAIIFSNPNNPTCRYYDKIWLKDLVKIAKKHNLYIIIDEIYKNTIPDNKKLYPIEILNKGYNNLIKVHGLSKDRPGLSGMRIGYCLMDKKLYNDFKNIHVIKNFSNSVISDLILLIDIAMRYFIISGKKDNILYYFDDSLLEDYKKTIDSNKSIQKKYFKLIQKELKKHNAIIDYIEPTSGNSIFWRYKTNLNPNKFVKELLNKGVFVYGSDVFLFNNKKYGTWSRICITQDINYLKLGLSKI